MSRSNYITIGLAILAFALASFTFLSKDKIAYVDSNKLIQNYTGAQEARAAYERKALQWKANIDTLSKALEDQIKKHNAEKTSMSKREITMSEELIQLKQQQLESYQEVVMQNAAREDQQISAQVLKEVNDFITMYGEAHNYRFILGATTNGNIVYADKGKDITDELIRELNARFKSSSR